MKFEELADPIQHNVTLNPKLWEGSGRLKSDVRGALLRIAEDFKEFCDIDFDIMDIVITGSNVNYNYTGHSDLDLHLIADYSAISCDREVAELFDTKRLLYDREYDIKIHGIPVGLYVEDSDSPGVSAGTYSVLNDQWIKEPKKGHPDYDLQEVEHMVKVWTTILEAAEQTRSLPTLRTALQLLRNYRKLGLQQPQGEFDEANLVYKVLRNQQILARVVDMINQLHDQSLSI
jgi:hypothetical protein